MLIVRPSWPEMYGNLTMELAASEQQGRDQGSIMLYLGITLVLAFHLKQHVSSESSVFFGVLCCSIGLLLLPVIILLLLGLWCYRQLVMLCLSKQLGYAGLMDGSDAYWSLEENASKAIINILGFVEYQPKNKQVVADLKTVIKATIQSRLLTDPQLYKLKCKKKLSKFGYYYWEKHRADIDEHIRWMEFDPITEDALQDYVSAVSNNPLPYENCSFWEILVGRKNIVKEGKTVYPVLFRVHHSVGDGISLVSMFLNSITDHEKEQKLKIPLQRIQQKQKMTRLLTREVSKLEQIFTKVNKALGSPLTKRASLTKMHNDFKKFNKHCIYSMTGLLQKISLLMFAPVVLSSQVLLGQDKNLLHGQELSGKKHLCWTSGEDLFKKVKKIKEALKCHFTDVILMAVSNSFENYFQKFGKPPETITLVIPARLPQEEIINGISMPTNGFTVALMKLPIADPFKFQSICWKTRKLRIEPHYLVNYWLLKVACTYCPLSLIKRGLRSEQVTLALSNIPGPEQVARLDGNVIQDLVFWVPNRDTTGVGVSILSYAGKLNFGLQIDQALVPSKENVQLIINGFTEAIDKMYECIYL